MMRNLGGCLASPSRRRRAIRPPHSRHHGCQHRYRGTSQHEACRIQQRGPLLRRRHPQALHRCHPLGGCRHGSPALRTPGKPSWRSRPRPPTPSPPPRWSPPWPTTPGSGNGRRRVQPRRPCPVPSRPGWIPRTPRQRRRWPAGNREYEEKFGRVFLIRAAGRTAPEILQALNSRLANTPAEEDTIVAQQLREIAVLRLEGLITE